MAQQKNQVLFGKKQQQKTNKYIQKANISHSQNTMNSERMLVCALNLVNQKGLHQGWKQMATNPAPTYSAWKSLYHKIVENEQN